MASVDFIERADSDVSAGPTPPTASIWGTDEAHGKKTRRRRAFFCAGISVLCGAILAIGLFLGLPESIEGDEGAGRVGAQSSSTAQQTDHNALGCFMDSQTNRTLVLEFVDPEGMTPDVSEIDLRDGAQVRS